MYSAKLTVKRGLRNIYCIKLKMKDNRIYYYVGSNISGYYVIKSGSLIIDAFDEVRRKVFDSKFEQLVKNNKSDSVLNNYLSEVYLSTLTTFNRLV